MNNNNHDHVIEKEQYDIVYADPPWKYRDTANAGDRGAVHKYEVMDLIDIKRLPIRKLAKKDSVLLLWCTMPFLAEGLSVISNWGFEYRTTAFNWIKRTKNWKLAWGMGGYTRSNPEMVLLGVRGKGVKRKSAGVHSVIEDYVREHSRKPDIVRSKIVELFGDLPRVELFARQKVDGWSSWGNEIQSDIDMDDYRIKI